MAIGILVGRRRRIEQVAGGVDAIAERGIVAHREGLKRFEGGRIDSNGDGIDLSDLGRSDLLENAVRIVILDDSLL